MYRFSFAISAVVLALALTSASAKTSGDDVNAILDKAIKAHGVKAKDDKKAYIGKSKGTLHIAGMELQFTQQVKVQAPDKFRETLDLDIGGMNVNVISGFDGKQGWVNAGGMDVKLDDDTLAEFKEAAHMMQLSQGMFLKDKTLQYSLLGEIKVKDRPAVGIKVSKKGYKDISFYFDKVTGLVTKAERRALDSQTKQEVTEERYILEYKDVDGRKIAKKVEVIRDGQAFMEAEVFEAQILERLDDSEFTKPG